MIPRHSLPTVVGRIIAPKDVCVIVPCDPWYVTLYGKSDFAVVTKVKLRLLEGELSLGLARWGQCHHRWKNLQEEARRSGGFLVA